MTARFSLFPGRGAEVANINAGSVNIRSGPGVGYSKVAVLNRGTQVIIVQDVGAADGYSWCEILFDNGTQKGYVVKDYVSSATVNPTVASSADFESAIAAFPESYKPYLRKVHQRHPNWTFTMVDTGLDWSEALKAESIPAKSLVESSAISSWKSTTVGYDWANNCWPIYDGTRWVAASSEIVAYYMDPRNFIDTDDMIFQFLDQTYNAVIHKPEDLEKMLSSSFMRGSYSGVYGDTSSAAVNAPVSQNLSSGAMDASGVQLIGPGEDPNNPYRTGAVSGPSGNSFPGSSGNSTPEPSGPSGPSSGTGGPGTSSASGASGYVDMLIKAAQESGVNPFVLAASILQEQGYSGTVMTSGNHSQYAGIYNFYNCNAYNDATLGMDAITRGLWWASGGDGGSTYGRPWNTPEKSIVGGAKMFGEMYVNKGQNTFYFKRFNVKNSTNTYNHQYMTNTGAAASEGRLLSGAYVGESRDAAHNFEIPVYRNMPASPAPLPTVDGNPNNKLNNLYVEGFSISPSFQMDITTYDLIVSPAVTELRVGANAIAPTSTVTGTGQVMLGDSGAEIQVAVTAQNGAVRTYTIHVVKQNGGTTFDSSASGPISTGPVASGVGITQIPGSSEGPGGSMSLSGPGSAGTGTFSRFWYSDSQGIWRVRNGAGMVVTDTWLCDDAVSANGKDVWYLLGPDGAMLTAGLLKDSKGNYYSIETNHNGYYGMLRCRSGTYDGIRLEIDGQHTGTFGAIRNADGIQALREKYGETALTIDSSNCSYTSKF